MKKKLFLFVILLALAAMFCTGCSEYHADIPEFTTNSDRG